METSVIIKFTPIALAIAFLTSGETLAAGGDAGLNGSSQNLNGSTIDLIGAKSYGAPGTANPDTNNLDGADGASLPVTTIKFGSDTFTGTAGQNGGSVSGSGGGGGGGHGGGTVVGGISAGGAGGNSSPAYEAPILINGRGSNGGSGGDVGGNTIKLTGTVLTGAIGGNGGNASSSGGGAAGHGGGSVIGGISSGGAAGPSTTYYVGSPVFANANGGSAGKVSGNSITLTGARY